MGQEASPPISRQFILKPGATLPYLGFNALGYHDNGRIVYPYALPPGLNIKQFEYIPPSDLKTFYKIWGMSKGGNNFNTRERKERIEKMVETHRENSEPINFITLVCPPYSLAARNSRDTIGLFTKYEEDPHKYNFDYDYRVITYCLNETAEFFSSIGIQTRSTIIIGDWALRGKDGMYLELSNDEGIKDALDKFTHSAEEYMEKGFPHISVNTFRNLAVPDYLPFGIPHTPEGKKDFMMSVIEYQNIADSPIHTSFFDSMQYIVAYFTQLGNRSLKLINPCEWKSLDLPGCANRATWIRFFQVLRNTAMSRMEENHDHSVKMDHITAGFWDALLKCYEYTIYGHLISQEYPAHLLAHFDTNYPASGLFLEEGGTNIVYLHPSKYLIPFSLGVKYNPF